MISITTSDKSSATTPNHNTLDITTPPSPTLSCTSVISNKSWMQKTPNELIPMLKNAYSTLKDKERDLRLAAEIGKSLLENNLALKSNYQDLLTNNNNNMPFPTPTNSASLLLGKQKAAAEKDKITITCQNIDQEEEEEEEQKITKEYEYVPPHRTREALVEILEKENADLSHQLEQTLLNQEKLERTSSKRARQLKAEVEFLQSNLDHATTKIQELEEYRRRKTLTFKDYHHHAKLPGGDGCYSSNSSTEQDDHQRADEEKDETHQQIWIDEKTVALYRQLEQLKAENHHVLQSKAELEKKFYATVEDLHLLKQEYDQVQFALQDHEKLKNAFEVQHLHVEELNQSLEEYRTILAKLKERGIYYISSSPSSLLLQSSSSNSSSFSNDDDYSIDEFESDDDSFFRRKIKEDTMKRDNLLTELENAWFKHQSTSPPQQKKPTSIFQPFQAIYNQLPNVDSALESIILKAGVVEKDALDDALSLIGRLENEYDHEKFLQEKRHIYYDKVDNDLCGVGSGGYLVEKKKIGDYYYNGGGQEEEYYNDDGDQDYYYYLQQQQQQQQRNTIEQQEEVPPRGIFGYVKYTINSIIFIAWQWFRFTLIMVIAICISLREGPNALSSSTS